MVALATCPLLATAVFAATIDFAACSPAQGTDGEAARATGVDTEPAAPVPTVVLTEETAGTPVLAETGDRVEVRLREAPDASGRWRLLDRSGEAVTFADERVEAGRNDGERLPPIRIFRFSAAAVGRCELLFGRGSRSLRFVVDVR